MAGVLVNNGEAVALSVLVNKVSTTENLILKLFKNNITPAETDVAATYTVADYTGYSNITLTGATWTVTPGAPGQATYPIQTFTSSADQALQSVYGYYLIRATSLDLVAAERFSDGPYSMVNNGDIIKVTPKITAD